MCALSNLHGSSHRNACGFADFQPACGTVQHGLRRLGSPNKLDTLRAGPALSYKLATPVRRGRETARSAAYNRVAFQCAILYRLTQMPYPSLFRHWAFTMSPIPRARAGPRRTKSMNSGTVKFFNDQRGCGFIRPDNGEKDVFIHATV